MTDSEEFTYMLETLTRSEAMFGVLTARLRDTLALYQWYAKQGIRVSPDVRHKAHRQLLDISAVIAPDFYDADGQTTKLQSLKRLRNAEVRQKFASGSYTKRELAKEYGISPQHIANILVAEMHTKPSETETVYIGD